MAVIHACAVFPAHGNSRQTFWKIVLSHRCAIMSGPNLCLWTGSACSGSMYFLRTSLITASSDTLHLDINTALQILHVIQNSKKNLVHVFSIQYIFFLQWIKSSTLGVVTTSLSTPTVDGMFVNHKFRFKLYHSVTDNSYHLSTYSTPAWGNSHRILHIMHFELKQQGTYY